MDLEPPGSFVQDPPSRGFGGREGTSQRQKEIYRYWMHDSPHDVRLIGKQNIGPRNILGIQGPEHVFMKKEGSSWFLTRDKYTLLSTDQDARVHAVELILHSVTGFQYPSIRSDYGISMFQVATSSNSASNLTIGRLIFTTITNRCCLNLCIDLWCKSSLT